MKRSKWHRIDFKCEVSNEGCGGLCDPKGHHTAWRSCFAESCTEKEARNVFEKAHIGEFTRIMQINYIPTSGIITL